MARTNRQEQHSGSSASVGIGFTLDGAQNGLFLNLGVSGNRVNADGDLNISGLQDTSTYAVKGKSLGVAVHPSRLPRCRQRLRQCRQDRHRPRQPLPTKAVQAGRIGRPRPFGHEMPFYKR